MAQKVEQGFQSPQPSGLSFRSVPVLTVLETCSRGSDSLSGLLEIMEGRLSLEKTSYSFSQTVSTKSLHELELRLSTGERTMGILKNYYLYGAMEQLKYQRAMKEGVVAKLSNLKTARAAVMQRSKTLIENSSREVKLAGEALNKAKVVFSKAKLEVHVQRDKLKVLEQEAAEAAAAAAEILAKQRAEGGADGEGGAAKGKGTFSKMFSAAFETTPEMERDKQAKRVGRRVSDLISASADIKTKKALLCEKISVRDFSVQQAVQALEDAEKERLMGMRSCVAEFCELERSALNEQSRLLKMLEDTVAEQNPEKDLADFVQEEKKPESTLKYMRALSLMDWDLARRGGAGAIEGDISFLAEDVEEQQASSPGQESVWKDSEPSSPPSPPSPPAPQASNVDASEVPPEAPVREQEPLDDGQAEELPSFAAAAAAAPATPSVRAHSSSLTAVDLSPQLSLSPSPASQECQQTITALQAIFSSNSDGGVGSDVVDLSESQWGVMMENPNARDLFLQALDEKRGTSACLGRGSFDAMAMAMTAVLNVCLQTDDIKTSMRVANMANTFHCLVDEDEDSSDSDDSLDAAQIHDEAAQPQPKKANASSGSTRRRYLQREPSIKHHKWWASEGFWEKALLEGVGAEMALRPPVSWDDLPQEALREAVLSVHNMVFGQLGALALTMRELGIKASEIKSTIMDMSRTAQLSEELEMLLVHSMEK